MENSISLGLLHGLVYGIVPVAPWFVALKRYLLEGKEKGQLAVAGTIAGQVTLLALTFFGWSKVLWVWYYFEPALIILGTMAVVRCALDCWVEQASSLQTSAVPLANKKEAFYYFLVNFGLMFCNPTHLEGAQTLISSIPGNRYFYLIAFTCMYTAVIFGFWATVGHRIFGKAYSGFGAQQTLNRFRIRRVAVAMVAALFIQFFNCTPETLVLYHFDSLLAYTPFDQLKHHKTRGYVWELGSNASGVEFTRGVPKTANKSGILNEQALRSNIQFKSMWNTEARYEECNQTRERELTNDDWNNEVTFHEFRGINQGTLKARLAPFHLYMVPKWEQQENKDYLLTLRKIRTEMDEKLLNEGSVAEQTSFLPFSDNWLNEIDYITDNEVLQERAESQAGYEEMQKFLRNTNWTSNHLHLGNGQDVEVSYAKLHKLPAEVRLPWHYPAVKPVETIQGNEIEQLNNEIQSNIEFLANEPERVQPNVYQRIWDYRNVGKVTPRPFDPERENKLELERQIRMNAFLVPEWKQTK